jgi:hypothetical protein
MSALNKRNSFRDTIWVFRGKSQLNKLSPVMPFKQSKRCIVFVGLHLYQEHAQTIDAYCKSLRDRDFDILQVFLYPTKDPKTISAYQAPDTLHRCLKDVSFSGFPKKEVLEKIQNFNADIFLNLNGSFSYADMGFALCSRAPYRISAYQLEYKPYFNILLKSRKDESLAEFLKSIDDFFKHLK